jgi:hypothetical protein
VTTNDNKEQRGAKKGENRFSKTQQERISFRLNRIKSIVIPKMRSICEKTHFKNVTSFRKMCAEVFNSDLPIGEKNITYRTFSNSPYWEEIGTIFHAFYSDSDNGEVNAMLMSLMQSEEVDKLKIEITEKDEEIALLSETILNTGSINPLALEDNKGSVADRNPKEIDNLVAIINWFIEHTKDIITVDSDNRQIRDESDDFNGDMDKRISETFFEYLDGKLH